MMNTEKKLSLLLWDANLIDAEGNMQSHKNIEIENGTITAITEYADGMTLPNAEESICCKDFVVTPGFVNMHAHAAMNIFKGIAEDASADAWFNEYIWPYESKMTEEDVYIGTKLAIAEMVSHGVTSFADHYFNEKHVLKAVRETGIRADIAPTIFGTAGNLSVRLTEVADLVDKYRDLDSRIRVRFGPHSPYTCPEPYLSEIIQAAKAHKSGIHLHISETKEQVQQSMAALGKTPFQVCYEAGCFDVNCLVAHGLWVEDEDLKYLGEDTWFGFCGKTYMKLAMGNGGIYRNKERLNFSFGTDGAASSNTLDILEQARMFTLIGKYICDDPTTYETAYIWKHLMDGHRALGFNTGKVESGYEADLVIWDLKKVNTFPVYNPLTALLYSADASNVKYTMVKGNFLKYDGRLTCVNEDELLAEVKEAHTKLLARGKGKAIVVY
ncbi:MAG: amidohydrolase family protein [Lachnospiraceae bacterium]|nr:amidohydrolase family protein [Lachnospiraceae bacterium]